MFFISKVQAHGKTIINQNGEYRIFKPGLGWRIARPVDLALAGIGPVRQIGGFRDDE